MAEGRVVPQAPVDVPEWVVLANYKPVTEVVQTSYNAPSLSVGPHEFRRRRHAWVRVVRGEETPTTEWDSCVLDALWMSRIQLHAERERHWSGPFRNEDISQGV